MTQEKMLIIRIASHLLQYPGEEMINSLSSISDWISELSPGRTREALTGFLAELRNRKILSLQEEYSRVFDLNAATCLNLSYHKHGDERERGAAMVWLKQIYLRAGYEIAFNELPDFLPMMLEFLSVCSSEEYAWIVQEYRSQMEVLSARLQETESPYAELLRVALDSI